ncbi:signal recognition particle subunit SRP54 2-like isoform X2 [Mercurialis annua]|uniref:signal recognition particle subunit SRP54 2-like isoform X2 n=1 Tax=Mercurialis annua TaxID=3986 RepID=UPI0021607651|nr:signal recognition particle subunit SRP54 2-like isoform X2 [Mercurialis annua]
MGLAELRGNISLALHQMNNASILDDTVLNVCLNHISLALFQADVHFKLVSHILTNIKNIAHNHRLVAAPDKRKIVHQAIFKEFCKVLDTGKPRFTPEKGKTKVVLFVGLQECGKTTACAKFAHYYRNRGWNPALVCNDTFSATSYDQLMQIALEDKIAFHGSLRESDPVKIAVEGVQRFKNENFDLIIVDTGGRHTQEALLLDETRRISDAIKPDLVIFVTDSSTGQIAFDHVQIFKESVAVGAVIVTKMDVHDKGIGTLTAFAATKIPVGFIETGESNDEFEVYEVESFVNYLLGTDELHGLLKEKTLDDDHDFVLSDRELEYLDEYNLRLFYQDFQRTRESRKLTGRKPEFKLYVEPPKVFPEAKEKSILEGLSDNKKNRIKFNCFLRIMDSMTNEELDDPNLMNCSCIMRIAKRCDAYVSEVMDMLEEYKLIARNFPKVVSAFSDLLDHIEKINAINLINFMEKNRLSNPSHS